MYSIFAYRGKKTGTVAGVFGTVGGRVLYNGSKILVDYWEKKGILLPIIANIPV